MAFGPVIDQRKLSKRNRVVSLFRERGALSKAEVRQLSGYSMDTIIGIFQALETEGYIAPAEGPGPAEGEGSRAVRGKGRPASRYSIVPAREVYLGTTFNSGGIHSVMVGLSGSILACRDDDLLGVKDQKAFEAAFRNHVKSILRDRRDLQDSLRRIGFALPGRIDASGGRLRHYGLMPFLSDFDPARTIRQSIPGIPVTVRHNVSGLARFILSEMGDDVPKGRVLFVSARSGAAHALIQDGQVALDDGEMGHIKVTASRDACDCGQTGCLDTVFSMPKFRIAFPDLGIEAIREALSAPRRGILRETLDIGYESFVEALLQLCAAFSPDAVVMTGELLSALPSPARWVSERLSSKASPSCASWVPTRVEFRESGPESAATGLCGSMIEEDWSWRDTI